MLEEIVTRNRVAGTEASIGGKVKELRTAQGLTLQQLADRTGFTKGYLSKVENSEKAPPVSTILTIARALNTSVAALFAEPEEKDLISLVRKSERGIITGDGTEFGYSYEPLAAKTINKHMESYVLTLPAQMHESGVFQHEDEEMLYVLEGTMLFHYGDQQLLVNEGDTLYFDASVPHFGVSHGDSEAKCLMVTYAKK